MPFQKGKIKDTGRTKGTKNKKTLVLDSFCQVIIDGGIEKFQKELKQLDGKDYINAYLQLLEYVKPKLSRAEIKADVKAQVKKVGYSE